MKGKADFEQRGINLIIRVNTDLDHHSEKGIRNEADRWLDSGYIRNVIFDFGGTDFMDSSGIGVLAGRYRKTGYLGGRLAVTGTNASIMRILKMSGMMRVIESFDSVEEACESFNKQKMGRKKDA